MSEHTACETPVDAGLIVFLVVTDNGDLVLLCHNCMSKIVLEVTPTVARAQVHPVWVQASVVERDVVCGQVVSRANPRLN
jgi:hypothetical protein